MNFRDQKKVSSLIQYDMTTGSRKVIAARVSDPAAPAFSGDKMHYRSDGKVNTVKLDNASLKSAGSEIFVTSEELTPVVYINGERKPVETQR
ncbi:MAG: hypothetical protein MZV63_20045 [Marinilabiliales bacterium]|nr:hypothetical protein [Marinilabiliales bacterium]